MITRPMEKALSASRASLVGSAAVLVLAGVVAVSEVRGQDSTVAEPRAPLTRPRAHKRVSIAPVVGVNFATWTGKDVGSGATHRTGVHAGLLVTTELGRVFAFQTGALYSQEGTGVELSGTNITGTFKVDYIRVPFLLKGRALLPGSAIRPYALFGPAFGFKIGCEIEASDGTSSATVKCDDPNIGLNLTTMDIGLHMGLGVDVGRFTGGFRYQPGIRSIDDTNTDATEVHNSLLALTAGFAF